MSELAAALAALAERRSHPRAPPCPTCWHAGGAAPSPSSNRGQTTPSRSSSRRPASRPYQRYWCAIAAGTDPRPSTRKGWRSSAPGPPAVQVAVRRAARGRATRAFELPPRRRHLARPYWRQPPKQLTHPQVLPGWHQKRRSAQSWQQMQPLENQPPPWPIGRLGSPQRHAVSSTSLRCDQGGPWSCRRSPLSMSQSPQHGARQRRRSSCVVRCSSAQEP